MSCTPVLERMVLGRVFILGRPAYCEANDYGILKAAVMPDDNDPLLGVIPLEAMDLWIHLVTNKPTPIHPGEGGVMIMK